MPMFRKKPVEIEARQFDGTNATELCDWIGTGERQGLVSQVDGVTTLHIQTLEGVMEVSEGDWVIRGVQGEHYPCKPDIFDATYEPI